MNLRSALSLAPVRLIVVALLALGAPAAWCAQGETVFAAQCASCHGSRGAGNEALKAPPLAGADADYLARQLRNFRNQVRGGPSPQGPAAMMQAVARGLNDDATILAIARYAASLKPVPAKPTPAAAAGPELNAGKALFAVCVSCHGSLGEGNTVLSAPRLTHLPDWYLSSQLQAFRNGQRGTHPQDQSGQQMRKIAAELLTDDESTRSVAAYITSLGARGK